MGWTWAGPGWIWAGPAQHVLATRCAPSASGCPLGFVHWSGFSGAVHGGRRSQGPWTADTVCGGPCPRHCLHRLVHGGLSAGLRCPSLPFPLFSNGGLHAGGELMLRTPWWPGEADTGRWGLAGLGRAGRRAKEGGLKLPVVDVGAAVARGGTVAMAGDGGACCGQIGARDAPISPIGAEGVTARAAPTTIPCSGVRTGVKDAAGL